MKRIIILFSVFFLFVSAQDLIKQTSVCNEILNSTEIIISLYSHHLKEKSELNQIHIVREGLLTDPPIIGIKREVLLNVDIITNFKERKNIIEYFYSKGFLDTLYLRINDLYINIENITDTFTIEEPFIVVDIFHNYMNSFMLSFFKINEFEVADKLLCDLKKFIEEENHWYIEKFRENIKKLKLK